MDKKNKTRVPEATGAVDGEKSMTSKGLTDLTRGDVVKE